MTVRKLSISLDSDTLERAKHAADAEGISLSAWLSRAADHAARLAEAKAAMADYIDTYGPFDEALMEEARVELRELGIGQPESESQRAARLAALARLSGHGPAEETPRAG